MPSENKSPSENESLNKVPAGRLAAWEVAELPPPPARGLRNWVGLLGPGVLLAGASVGTGEWLFGPAVSAQYGGTLLWLATLSILGQVFCNLEMMRYTLYCGEPMLVGGLRTRPGPLFWIICYALLDFAAIFPYNASNAAVPLAAAILGHLPGNGDVSLLGMVISEVMLVKWLGYTIFLAAFVPLIFGGTIYKMLERAMTLKLVIVLGYLAFVGIFMIAAPNVREVLTGFFRFGQVPLRAETIVAGRHFTVSDRVGEADREVVYTLKGTLERGNPLVTEFSVAAKGKPLEVYKASNKTVDTMPREYVPVRDRLLASAVELAGRNELFIRDTYQDGADTLELTVVAGRDGKGTFVPREWTVADRDGGQPRSYARLEDVPRRLRPAFAELSETQGIKRRQLASYVMEHKALPPLDWAMLAAFAAIAGAGGFTNAMFSNYARDKGWGMGAAVGAIPSAVGGLSIGLSHVGKVFRLDAGSLERWKGWMRHVRKDQIAIWMVCSFVGMALPCMLSLEFIRHAPVEGNRVAALTAEGMADRYPDYAGVLWLVTLMVGFLILAPGQIMASDILARRWTDIIWSFNFSRRMNEKRVKYVYYGILVFYGIWGLFALYLFDPLQTAKLGAALQNVALGFSAFLGLYVNLTLLPKPLRPRLFSIIGTALCGVFFIGISLVVVRYL